MSFTKAQARYDAQLPPEDPEEHSYSGDVVVGDTLFTYWYGKIILVTIDEEGTTIPYTEWKGPDSLVVEADVKASEQWSAELEGKDGY